MYSYRADGKTAIGATPDTPRAGGVTFTNSFAIEGHYFNFSTSGQWLWDELKVVVPAGLRPLPDCRGHHEAKWSNGPAEAARQSPSKSGSAPFPRSAARFLGNARRQRQTPSWAAWNCDSLHHTRAHERFLLRAKLYQAAVDLLGEKPRRSNADVRAGPRGARRR